MEKIFYIFRHGQSTYNLTGHIQGQTNDSVLTELGKQQALQIGYMLKNKQIEIIITSPLKRAQQTAQFVNQSLNVPLLTDNRFTEVNVGEIEGMYYQDVLSFHAEKYQKWRSNHPEYENLRFQGGESKKEVRERVLSGLTDYAVNAPYQRIAISSHGIMLTQLLLYLGLTDTEIPNGAILCIHYQNNVFSFKDFLK